jgi:hypothetical protein
MRVMWFDTSVRSLRDATRTRQRVVDRRFASYRFATQRYREPRIGTTALSYHCAVIEWSRDSPTRG